MVREEQLSVLVLSDSGASVVRDYGLLHEGAGPDGEDIAIPAQILVAQDGRIVWRHVARKIQDRAYPEETLAAIEELEP